MGKMKKQNRQTGKSLEKSVKKLGSREKWASPQDLFVCLVLNDASTLMGH